MKRKSRIRPRRRAGALAFALIITACLAICAGALLSLSGTEHRLTLRRTLVCETHNAAESAVNFGISQIVSMTDSGNLLLPGILSKRPLKAPTPKQCGTGGLANIDAVELFGGYGLVSNRVQIPFSSINEESRGHWVFPTTIPILAHVRATTPGGSPVEVYAKAHLVIRDDPLFNYAVFYDGIPLEIAPGGPMTIGGDIRSNSDIYLANDLTITGSVMSAGKIRGGSNWASGRSSGARSIYVAYEDKGGDGFSALKDGNAAGNWNYDERRLNDKQEPLFAANKDAELVSLTLIDKEGKSSFLDSDNPNWKDFADTVTKKNIQDVSHGIPKVMPPGITSGLGHNLIDPPVMDAKSPLYNAEAESAKYGNKAGLYLVVEPGGGVSGFKNAAAAAAYKANKTAETRESWKAKNLGKVIDLTGTGIVSLPPAFNDSREKKDVTPVDLNLGKLREYIAGKGTGEDGKPVSLALEFADKTPYALDTPDTNAPKGWNGVVYVDVEKPLASLTNPADTRVLTAVRLTNAKEVPNRSATNPAGATGFTLATNAPLYTLGNVNADGDFDTGTNSMPDKGLANIATKTNLECPVSLVADAITTLSANFGSKDAPAFTEISAALTVGVVKSGIYDKEGNLIGKSYSGGLENYPRLLEQWNDRTLRIRGSLTALYESTVATGKWSDAVYSIPTRDWGFSRIFADGHYPPGTPILRSYRRVNFRIISAEEYGAILNNTVYKRERPGEWTLQDGTTRAKFVL